MPSNRRGRNTSSEMSDYDGPPGKSWCYACDSYYVNRHDKDAQRHFSTKQHEKNAQIKTLDDNFTDLLRESPVVTDQYNIRPCIRNIHNCVYSDINDDEILGEAAVRRVISELKLSEEPAGQASSSSGEEEPRIYNPSEKSRLKEFFEKLRLALENVKVEEITMLVQQMMMVFAMQVVDTGETLDYVPYILPDLCHEQLKIVPQGLELARHYCERVRNEMPGYKLEKIQYRLTDEQAAQGESQSTEAIPEAAEAGPRGVQGGQQSVQAGPQGGQQGAQGEA